MSGAVVHLTTSMVARKHGIGRSTGSATTLLTFRWLPAFGLRPLLQQEGQQGTLVSFSRIGPGWRTISRSLPLIRQSTLDVISFHERSLGISGEPAVFKGLWRSLLAVDDVCRIVFDHAQAVEKMAAAVSELRLGDVLSITRTGIDKASVPVRKEESQFVLDPEILALKAPGNRAGEFHLIHGRYGLAA